MKSLNEKSQLVPPAVFTFCAFGFAARGTIILETEDYRTKALVGPIVYILQTEILIK